jgi:branched-chain amino acid transport system permease protein
LRGTLGSARFWVPLAIFAAVLGLPLLRPEQYWLYVLTIGFYYAILSSSWSFLVGYVGRISFAHAAMSGIGAYSSALASLYFHVPTGMTILMGVLLTGFVGLIIGWLCLRLHGPYLGLTTIAFSEIFRITVTAEYGFTRGSLGLPAPPLVPGAGPVTYYYVFFSLLMATLLVMWLILRSRIGLFFAAIREDEDAAASLGVKVVRWKVVAFTVSSMLAGLAGGCYAHFVQLVAPSMMSLLEMGFILSMAVVGGFQNIFYAALGGILLELILESLRDIGEWRLALVGLVMVAVLRFAPNGVFAHLLPSLRRMRQ